MNVPGEPEGHWAWRFEWSQLAEPDAVRLAALAALYGR